jgi:class 3 adenylate cyclase
VDTAGDGFFASFDGPARGIRCAQAIATGVRPLGIEVRAGLHTGECEVIGGKVGGIAVHIGARVAGLAGPSEVLVSSTVKDLVAGSGLRFEERGLETLKGVPGEWRLFSVSFAA